MNLAFLLATYLYVAVIPIGLYLPGGIIYHGLDFDSSLPSDTKENYLVQFVSSLAPAEEHNTDHDSDTGGTE